MKVNIYGVSVQILYIRNLAPGVNWFYHTEAYAINCTFIIHRSNSERINLLGQRQSKSDYDPFTFLEPSTVNFLHQREIPDTISVSSINIESSTSPVQSPSCTLPLLSQSKRPPSSTSTSFGPNSLNLPPTLASCPPNLVPQISFELNPKPLTISPVPSPTLLINSVPAMSFPITSTNSPTPSLPLACSLITTMPPTSTVTTSIAQISSSTNIVPPTSSPVNTVPLTSTVSKSTDYQPDSEPMIPPQSVLIKSTTLPDSPPSHELNGSHCEDTPPSPQPPPYSPVSSDWSDSDSESLSIDVPTKTALKHSDIPPPISNFLPKKYTYIFQEFCSISSQTLSFRTTFYINVNDEVKAKVWISDFESFTNTTYRITRGTKTKGTRLVYKSCRTKGKRVTRDHPKKTGLQTLQKTDCDSTLLIKVHSQENFKVLYRSHPCEVLLHWEHNHSIKSAHALSFRPVSEETKLRFFSYFDQGHSPGSAKHLHSLNLAMEHEGNVEQVSADRSINPLSRDVYYMFEKWREKKHGKDNGESMFELLEKKICTYNESYSKEGGRAYIQRYGRKESTWENREAEQPLVLAICTPLMARAHHMIQQSGELIYCDSTASLDRYNCPTFIISTSSSAGGIPLGVVVTSGEDESTITEAINFLKMVLPKGAFCGRGLNGPKMCITDDCTAERTAIKNNWPDIELYLCIFHYLQSWWTWLWDSKQGIHKEDRPTIMQLVKNMVFTRSNAGLEEQYTKLVDCEHSIVQGYPKVIQRLKVFWERRFEWALSYRMDKLFRHNHTNNYAEAGVRVLKEIVFGRLKAYNLVQMFDFMTVTMEKYYTNRLLDIAHSRFRPGIALRYSSLHKSKDIVKVEQYSEPIYSVTETLDDDEVEFLLDMEIGTCSCLKGVHGAACRHQAAVTKKFNIHAVNIPPFFSKEARRNFAILALGEKKVLDLNFYVNLREEVLPIPSNVKVDCEMQEKDERSCEVVHLPADLSSSLDGEDFGTSTCKEWSDIIDSYRAKLSDITNDLLERAETGDGNLLSGLNSFIKVYKKMQGLTSSTPSIAHALHQFGKADSK